MLAAEAVIIFVVALRDIPARPAVGDARRAFAGRAIIEYYASGPGENAVVVLFPSFARSAADFNELVRDLAAAGFRTLAVQPRGIQGSTLPSGNPTYHAYAADLSGRQNIAPRRTPESPSDYPWTFAPLANRPCEPQFP